MATADIRDFVIRSATNARYRVGNVTENRPIEVLLQKLENILQSNKGDILGDPDFGCNLEYYLWRTDAPKESIRRTIYEQVNQYIPELFSYNFKADVELYEGTYRDIMYVNITIQDNEVNFNLR